MGLKDLIRDVHGPSELKPSLDIYLRSLKDAPREPGWHPSEFAGMCARNRVIQELSGAVEKPFKVTPRLRRIFDIGTAVHWWYQNRYLGPMGVLWGKWRCSACRDVAWGFLPKHDCKCQRSNWTYREVPVRKRILGGNEIVGHSDGLVWMHGLWSTIEVKTINNRGYTTLYRPKDGHLDQAQIYTELIRQGHVPAPEGTKVPKPERVVIFYINKDNSEEKEFSLKPATKEARENIEQPARYEHAYQSRTLPQRLFKCVNRLKGRPKNCPSVDLCFRSTGVDWKTVVLAGNRP